MKRCAATTPYPVSEGGTSVLEENFLELLCDGSSAAALFAMRSRGAAPSIGGRPVPAGCEGGRIS